MRLRLIEECLETVYLVWQYSLEGSVYKYIVKLNGLGNLLTAVLCVFAAY